ncbi:MAG: glycosyltransferase family 39 protein [Bacteroidales bacterium]|nr:glycosyltransferase family 39 protein [Bacteroidales bacterium]
MKRTLLLNIIIALLGALIFIPGLGCVRLFDWDEINFAESAREMLLTGNWLDVQINFQPFWEKPPLFIWMQALSMKVFGVNEFAARFPNAVMGIVTLLLLFNIGRRTEGERFGLLWAMMYGISFLPFLYFKSGIIDPWFNVFIFLGIYYFARYSAEEARRMRLAALSALFLGLATMTKGPVGFLIFCLTAGVWLIVRRFRFSFRWKDVGVFFAVLALVGGSWFLVLALSGHSDVIRDFIQYQIRLFQTKDAGHGGFFLYHFVILLLGVVPASIFALSCFERNSNTVGPLLRETAPSRQKNWVNDVWTQSPSDGSNLASGRKEPVGPSGGRVASDGISPMSLSSEGTLPAVNGANLKSWMIVSFWVVLILFTIVKTKIVHYSSFCFFPISFMAAWAAERMMEGRLKFRRYQRILLIVIASAYGFLLAGLAQFDSLKEIIIPYVQDPFAVSCMAAESNWTSWVYSFIMT